MRKISIADKTKRIIKHEVIYTLGAEEITASEKSAWQSRITLWLITMYSWPILHG